MVKYSNYLSHQVDQKGYTHDDQNQSNLEDIGNQNNTNSRSNNGKVLCFCVISTFIFALIEAIGGYYTHSITLQSDAVHMLTDALGLLIAYIANSISKKPANIYLTYGYGNVEAIGALVNCIFTTILTFSLLFEVINRFFKPITVSGYGVFVIAAIGFLVNASLAIILAKNSNSLNIKAALIHTLGDLLASSVAIIAGIIIYYTQFSLIDPILSLIVIFILIISNYKLIKKSIIVLMSGVPSHLNYEEIGDNLKTIPGVVNIHDLHIWYMNANKTALSAHIVIKEPQLWNNILLQCQKLLTEKYAIEHITIQHEEIKNVK